MYLGKLHICSQNQEHNQSITDKAVYNRISEEVRLGKWHDSSRTSYILFPGLRAEL